MYRGHSLQVAALSNSPAAQIPFATTAITTVLFVVLARVCVCVIRREREMQPFSSEILKKKKQTKHR